MQLKWVGNKITTPAEIETHNNMVRTLWEWRHAGLVIETDGNERLPEPIDTPKRTITCSCGNDDLHKFTLMSMGDAQTYSFRRYSTDGCVEAEYCETNTLPDSIAIELGVARPAKRKTPDGQEYGSVEWKYLIICDTCRKHEAVWSGEMAEFVEFY